MEKFFSQWDVMASDTKYVLTLIALGVLVLMVNAILRGLLNWMIKAAEKTKTPWDEVCFKALSNPLRTLLWGFALCVAAHLLLALVHLDDYTNIIYIVAKTMLMAAIVWFCLRFVKFGCDHFLEEYTKTHDKSNLLVDPASIRAIKRISSILIFVLAALVMLGIFHIPISGLLTFGGISGAVLAFSAKDMMSNFFGGLLIYFDRPFSIGDWISSPDKQLEGTVEKIGWRLTRIRSFDKRPIYVPNAVFTNAIVVNPSRMTNRRIKQNIGVRYEDAAKLPKILDNIRQMLKEHPEIDQKATTLVNLVNGSCFGQSAIVFNVYTFTKTTDWVKFQCIQDDVMLKVEAIILRNEAEIAFPTRTVKVQSAGDVVTG